MVFQGHFSGISQSYCLVRETVTALCYSLVAISIIGIGIERWYATKTVSSIAARATAFLENPASSGRKPVFKPILMVIGFWVIALLSAASWFISAKNRNATNASANNTNESQMCFCDAFSSHSGKKSDFSVLYILVGVYFANEVAITSLYFYVWRVNKTKLEAFSINTARHSLQERFQIRENIQTTKLMIPTVTVHALCWITYQVAMVIKGTIQ